MGNIEQSQEQLINPQILEDFKVTEDRFEEWKKYLNTHQKDYKIFEKILENHGKDKILAYFSDNSLFLNEDEFKNFSKEFPINRLSQEENIQRGRNIINQFSKKVDLDVNLFKQDDKIIVESLVQEVEKLKQGNTLEDISEVFFYKINSLSDEGFNTLMQSIKKTDEKLYEEIKTYHLEVSQGDESVKRKYVLFESTTTERPVQISPDKPDRVVQAILGDENGKIERRGNLLEKIMGDKVIQYDLESKTSYMKLKNTDYALRRRLPERVFKETVFRKEQRDFDAKIQNLISEESVFKSLEVKSLSGREGDILEKEDREFYYNYITRNLSVGEPRFKDELVGEFKNKETITVGEVKVIFQQIYKKIDEVKNQTEKIFEGYKNIQINKYKQEIEKEDQKQQALLTFFHSIGFDLIPQSITDQLIREVNQRQNLQIREVNETGGLAGPIDIRNGDLGAGEGQTFQGTEITGPAQIGFKNFFLQMIYGEKIPQSLTTGITITGDEKKKIESYITTDLGKSEGNWKIGKMRTNLGIRN